MKPSSRIVLRVGNGDNIDIDDSIDRAIQRTREYSRRCVGTQLVLETGRYVITGTFERYGIHHALLGVRRLISSRPVIKCGYPFLAFINPARTFSRRNAIAHARWSGCFARWRGENRRLFSTGYFRIGRCAFDRGWDLEQIFKALKFRESRLTKNVEICII